MSNQLYRKLELGETIEAEDILWVGEEGRWTSGKPYRGSKSGTASAFMRPVDVQQIPDYEIAYSEANASPDSLTKRERFAMAAMQGLLGGNDEDGFRSRFDPKYGTALALEWADALIAALNAKEAE